MFCEMEALGLITWMGCHYIIHDRPDNLVCYNGQEYTYRWTLQFPVICPCPRQNSKNCHEHEKLQTSIMVAYSY